MGFTLTKKEVDKNFVQFKELADKKKVVSDWDIEALVHDSFLNLPEVYHLEQFIINSGNTISSTANIKLSRNNETREEVAKGDGPVDAAFKAIEKIIGMSFKLEDYFVHSVTSGKDAQGEVVVKISKDKRTVVGRGLSTDIVEASILAFLNAVNKIINEGAAQEGRKWQKK